MGESRKRIKSTDNMEIIKGLGLAQDTAMIFFAHKSNKEFKKKLNCI